MPDLLPAYYHTAVFGEQERALPVQGLHSSVPNVRLLSAGRPERLLKGTREVTGLKGDGVLIVMWFFTAGFFAGLSSATGEPRNQLPKASSMCHADEQKKNTRQAGTAAHMPTEPAGVNAIACALCIHTSSSSNLHYLVTWEHRDPL